MKRIIIALLCLCLLLSACNGTPDETQPSTQETAASTTEPTTEATTAPTTEPTTVPTTEAPVLYQHPLTGEMLEQPMTTQPVAVIINNISSAQPLHGIGAADILFEHVAEGGGTITRMLGIFTDLESAGKLGSIRSARTYMIDLARNFNAPIVHCGYSDYARQDLNRTGYPSYNQFFHADYFYRDQDRRAAGYSLEHTMMIDGPDLLKGLIEDEFDMTVEADVDYGMDFAEDVSLNGAPASTISFKFYSSSGKTTTMTYDEDDGVYYGTQKWKTKQTSIADGNTDEAVPFRNVLILNVKTTTDGYRMFSDMEGEGTGYYACGGTYVPIKWHRESTSESFTYTYEDGTPLELGVGKTYIAIRPSQSPDIVFE